MSSTGSNSMKDTDIEQLCEIYLQQSGQVFEKQKDILNKTIVDFFISPNICIFVDGCYWHNCPKCFNIQVARYKLDEHVMSVAQRDIKITDLLQNNNYRVYRVWGHEVHQNDFSRLEGAICHSSHLSR